MNIRKLKPDEIECRVAQVSAKGCSLLLYKTARVDRAILNETFGELWQNDFKVIDGKMYGGIGVYNEKLNQWLWRWDCGIESNTEAEKGQASDCFKRAGFKWGIGIELYSAPFIWLNVETEKDGNKYKLVNKYAKYCVKSIGYAENGNINTLIISDDNHNEVFNLKNKPEKKETPKQRNNDDKKIFNILEKIEDIEELKSYYSANKENVTDRKLLYSKVQEKLNKIKNKA